MSDQPFDQHGTDLSTRDVAKEETAHVASDAKEGARSVAQTASAEAQNVAGEARDQITSLYQQVRQDVTSQASSQQQRAAGGLHGIAGELTQMADSAEQSSMATGLARQAAERLDGVAGWLEQREPSDLLEDVKRYARRNPATFLAACAVVGLVGGRLTRSLRDDASDTAGGSRGSAPYAADYASPATPGTFAPGAGAGYGGRPTAGAQTFTATGVAVGTPGYDEPVATPAPGGPGTTTGYDARPTDALYDDDIQAVDGEPEVYPGTSDAGLFEDGGERR